ncbi:MAG: hypothetical protein EOM65_06435 [Synergistales bacterium]|jgi:hypothetical protein|nr:hypothetical protein [Synergistales bacterium]
MTTVFFFLFISIFIFSVGDILGVATKARLSSVFVALMLFLVGFLTGILPPDIIKQSMLGEVARWSPPFIIFHMGTMINIRELLHEWRTVLMSCIAMAVAAVSIFAVVPLIGMQSAIVGIPIINGGIVATQIMTEAAMAKGFTLAAALGAIVYAIQKFVGTPPASFFGLKEAELVLKEYREKGSVQGLSEKGAPAKRAGALLYEKLGLDRFYTPFTCLGVTAFFAWLSFYLQGVSKGMGMTVSYSIWALILGAVAGHIGIVPEKILDKGKSSGFFSMVVFAAIIPSLATIKVGDLQTLLFQTVVIFVAVMAGTFLFMYFLPLWKIVGSRNLSVGIAMAQMLGFPATYLIANEIATAVTNDDKEREIVLKKIMPAYVVAGFASVTSISIIIAGIFADFLK